MNLVADHINEILIDLIEDILISDWLVIDDWLINDKKW